MAPNHLSFRGLTFPLFHPQLPLSPRQQDQLLELLTSTFNSHLDKRYGSLPSKPSDSTVSSADSRSSLNQLLRSSRTSLPQQGYVVNSVPSEHSHNRLDTLFSSSGNGSPVPVKMPKLEGSAQPAVSPSSPPRRSSSFAATDSHIQAILTNPLFDTKPIPKLTQSHSPTKGYSKIPSSSKLHASSQLNDVKSVYSMMSNPDAWFKGLIASGSVDINTACVYLESVNWKATSTRASLQKRDSQMQSTGGQHVDSIANTTEVGIVLNWIWASNQIATNRYFFKSYRLSKLLGRFIGASRMRDLTISWLLDPKFQLEALQTGFHQLRDIDRWRGMLLVGLVDVELARDPSGLGGLSLVLDLTTRVRANIDINAISHPSTRVLHYPAIRMIQHFTSPSYLASPQPNIKSSPIRSDTSPSLKLAYNQFIANIELYTHHVQLYTALLKAFHPTSPDHDPIPGYNYLVSLDHLGTRTKSLLMPQVTLGLAVASAFMSKGQADKAEEVLNLVVNEVGKLGRPDAHIDEGSSLDILPGEHATAVLSSRAHGNDPSRTNKTQVSKEVNGERESLDVLDRLFA